MNNSLVSNGHFLEGTILSNLASRMNRWFDLFGIFSNPITGWFVNANHINALFTPSLRDALGAAHFATVLPHELREVSNSRVLKLGSIPFVVNDLVIPLMVSDTFVYV